ncbi:MAG: multiheme c-type cytochrome [Paludibaculum sp.]
MRLGIPVFIRSVVLCLAAVAGLWAGQKPVPAPTSPNTVCLDCHDQGAKLDKSAHSKVACSSCHLKHDQYPHPENLPKPVCVTCHEQPANDYSQSEHAQQMKRATVRHRSVPPATAASMN